MRHFLRPGRSRRAAAFAVAPLTLGMLVTAGVLVALQGAPTDAAPLQRREQ
ncbi:MAG: hypothetical protein OXF51_10010 [Alphaproteobacteria bacterium]|nr:hypothetical protein [Alphaproteobacteria bacterium]